MPANKESSFSGVQFIENSVHNFFFLYAFILQVADLMDNVSYSMQPCNCWMAWFANNSN